MFMKRLRYLVSLARRASSAFLRLVMSTRTWTAAARPALTVKKRCAVSEDVADLAVVEGQAELEILDRLASGGPLGGQLVCSQFAAVLDGLEMARPDFFGCRQRCLRIAGVPQ